MEMPRRVGLTAVDESNAFLRCIWAEMRQSFGHLRWVYAASRWGKLKRIRIGQAQLGPSRSIEVWVSYRQKGIIEDIIFTESPGRRDFLKTVSKKLDASVEAPLNRFKHPGHVTRSRNVQIWSELQ